MSNLNKINFFYICFLIIIIFSLIQGFYCRDNTNNVCSGFFKNYWNENGFIENLQAIFVLASIILLIKLKLKLQAHNFIHVFITIKILALIYYLGEEISWGQHFFKWGSPILFQEINNQKETNLHNISNLFDQLPRALVYFWCAFSIYLANLDIFKNKINTNLHFIISPNKKLINISLLLLILSVPDIIVDLLNLHPGHVDEFGIGIPASLYYDIFTFNFVRLSELHELIFSFYFLCYSTFLYRNKLKQNY
tara:strand:+ start:26 stop:778 length:753 start_codon:yes stop_codon:yes gene_type:complete